VAHDVGAIGDNVPWMLLEWGRKKVAREWNIDDEGVIVWSIAVGIAMPHLSLGCCCKDI
jgi:hypothetical protein